MYIQLMKYTNIHNLHTHLCGERLFVDLCTGRRRCIGSLNWSLNCKSLSTKEPLIIGLFCGRWPIKTESIFPSASVAAELASVAAELASVYLLMMRTYKWWGKEGYAKKKEKKESLVSICLLYVFCIFIDPWYVCTNDEMNRHRNKQKTEGL